MITLFLSGAMQPSYQNITTFPTLFFSGCLVICILYWLVAMLGLIELDLLNLETSNGENDALTPELFTGLLMKWGLHGAPIAIVLSLISLFGWLACYYGVHLLADFMPSGQLKDITESLILLSALYLAIKITALIIWPIRPLFAQATPQDLPQLIGRTAVVRSLKVNNQFGEAFLDNGGAGLILKIRSTDEETFKKGDKVILLSYEPDMHVYQVISEQTFMG